jgi:hypothetical protein
MLRLSPLATGRAQLARSAKDRPRQRKDIMARKDVMHRTEGAVADLPTVKVRGIAVGGIVEGKECVLPKIPRADIG